MSLASDLLEQAHFLARRDKRRPRHASLRRAVSTAYYAVFHLLTEEAAAQAGPATPAGLRVALRRCLDHGPMKNAAQAFESGKFPEQFSTLVATPVPAELIAIAKAFGRLQQQRHRADYDLLEPFSKAEAIESLADASKVFSDWKVIRASEEARLFLAAWMFPRRGNR